MSEPTSVDPRSAGTPTSAGTAAPVPVQHARRDQDAIWQEFLAMGRSVVDSLAKSITVLCERRFDVVGEVKQIEKDSDSAELRIEQECLRALALFEPVASDLRRLATILKVSRDWERIADLAARIARRTRKLAKMDEPAVVPDRLKSLARTVLGQVRDSYEALVQSNAELARAVIAGVRSVAGEYRRLRGELKDSIRQRPQELDAWLELMSIARHLERAADHTIDVAQSVVYLQEGIIIRHRTGASGAAIDVREES